MLLLLWFQFVYLQCRFVLNIFKAARPSARNANYTNIIETITQNCVVVVASVKCLVLPTI